MSQDLYQEIILDAFKYPQNKGSLSDADAYTTETNASCGDTIEIFLKFDEKKEHIQSMKWNGVGCAISMATASLLSEFVKGKTLAEVTELKQEDLEKLIGIEKMSPGRVKCLGLSLRALKKAIALI